MLRVPNDQQATFSFGTKAETLATLKGLLVSASLCDQMFFSRSDWSECEAELLAAISHRWSCDLAIRSSAQNEDTESASMAGAFESVIDVPGSDKEAICRAIHKVFSSFGSECASDQVLVQPMVRQVALSGVATSRDLSSGGPYFVINYDDFSGRTDSVTSGKKSKAIAVLRTAAHAVKSTRISAIIETILELERITGCNSLDVEFCMTETDELYILQVRRLILKDQRNIASREEFEECITRSGEDLIEWAKPNPGLAGRTTVFGQMPDWNPAEMIGAAPKPLAYSLYRNLITERTWSEARSQMGYQDVGHHSLMVNVAGRPYIDVRLSLNSFLPIGLSPQFCSQWIDYQIDKLSRYRGLHDKIEFEIAVTCLDLDFDRRRHDLIAAGLNSAEIDVFKDRLCELTNAQVGNSGELYFKLVKQLEDLESRRKQDSYKIATPKGLFAALEDTRKNGLLPFAQIARHGFIAVSFLKSLVSRGLISQEQRDIFLGSIRTVAYDFIYDTWRLNKGSLKFNEFMETYGHLRPGTYDINSMRYDELPKSYFLGADSEPASVAIFSLSNETRRLIDRELNLAQLSFNSEQLFSYMREAIRLREWSKFMFSRSISDIINGIAQWSCLQTIPREDVAYLDIDDITNELSTEILNHKINAAKLRYSLTQSIRLPHVIIDSNDLKVVRIPIGEPTFITAATVIGTCAPIEELDGQLEGKIILIESADPGYDWIFSHRIAALITKFGGANSHMAIRCAEFGIPAAIGCGERIYEMAVRNNTLELNCSAKTIRFPS